MTQSLTLHALLSNHAVIQRDRPIVIHGSARPHTAIKVLFAGEARETQAEERGDWSVTYPPRSAGGPLELVVEDDQGGRLERSDLLIGDVWFASGQSNMEWPLKDSDGVEEELARPADPGLRLFTVPRTTSPKPLDGVNGEWSLCSKQSTPSFSAIAYFFARRIRELGVPVGIIAGAWGGTRIASWLPFDSVEPEDRLPPRDESIAMDLDPTPYPDPGDVGFAQGLASIDYDDSGWGTLELPALWQHYGHYFNGAVWFRRTVDVPSELAGREARLELGPVDDFDVTYVNGNEVGRTGPETPSAYAKPRVYKVAAGCLRPGRNVIAVRVFDQWGGGGFAGSARAMRLIASDDPSRCIPLAGPWRMHIEHALRPWRTFSVDVSTSELYNGMVHPLRRSPIRGVLWYQGESDVGRADRYRLMFRDLILRWRAMWQDETLPFLFVQLAGFHPLPEVPGDDEWAELREAQATALALPNTGMAVALDVGNPEDIHPRNKRAVGERLALWALQMVHGEKSLEVSGPMLRTHGVRGSEIHVEFDHAAGLRTRDGGEVRGFQIVDDLGEHHWAEAVIQGDTVIVSHPNVRAPRAVRYGWSGSSLANVVNGAGLPAVPFRTDAP